MDRTISDGELLIEAAKIDLNEPAIKRTIQK
jgi:hypothetical protein